MNLDDIDDISDIQQQLGDDDLFTLLDDIIYENNNELEDEPSKDISSKNYCNNCKNGEHIVEDFSLGIIVCKSCGSVVANMMDKKPEWRQYGEDGKSGKGRCSVVTSHFLPQSSLGTNISGLRRSKIKILHNWSKMPYKERSLNIVLKEIQSRCEKAGILKCIEHDAKILYRNISECKHIGGKNKGKYIIIRGTNRKSLIAACVFFACKRKGHTRSPKEIASLFNLKYTEITKGCKTFIKLMKIKKMAYDYNTSTPEHFIPRFCKELSIHKNYIQQATQIVKNIQKLNIASEHTPLSVATGAILLMSDMNGLPISKKQIANKFGVSEVTITKTYRRLDEYKDIILNTQLTDYYVKKLEEKKKDVKMPKELLKKFDKRGVDTGDYKIEEDNEIEDNSIEIEDDPIEYGEFDICSKNNDLDEYLDSINVDVYAVLANTDNEYNIIMSELSETI